MFFSGLPKNWTEKLWLIAIAIYNLKFIILSVLNRDLLNGHIFYNENYAIVVNSFYLNQRVGLFVLIENIRLIWRGHHCQCRTTILWFMLDTYDLFAGKRVIAIVLELLWWAPSFKWLHCIVGTGLLTMSFLLQCLVIHELNYLLSM